MSSIFDWFGGDTGDNVPVAMPPTKKQQQNSTGGSWLGELIDGGLEYQSHKYFERDRQHNRKLDLNNIAQPTAPLPGRKDLPNSNYLIAGGLGVSLILAAIILTR